jgi:glycosyltransferase involved in cell wall biosynthesis
MMSGLRQWLVVKALARLGTRVERAVTFENPNDLALLRQAGAISDITDQDLAVVVRGAGVDFRVFYTDESRNNAVPVVAMASRLLHSKGALVFLNAAHLVLKRGIAARFLLAGPIDRRNRDSVNEREVAQLCIPDEIEWVGALTPAEMPDFLRKSDLFCLPTTLNEGLPRVLIEAAACGNAMIATDIPACREIVVPGYNGWLLDPVDPQTLADVMLSALGNRERLATTGKNASEFAQNNGFSERAVQEQFLRLYQ